MEMSEKDDAGQRDQKAAEQRTQQVARENEQRKQAEGSQEQQGPPRNAVEAIEQGQDIDVRVGPDATPQRADDAPFRAPVHAHLDPYPDYAQAATEDLAGLAEQRNVEIPRDQEKAQLIHELRLKDGEAVSRGEIVKQIEGADNPYASYDIMPLEELRKLAEQRDVQLPEWFLKAHLISALRANDTHAGGGVSVQMVDGTRI